MQMSKEETKMMKTQKKKKKKQNKKKKFPELRMNPKNPTEQSRNKNMKIVDMLFTGICVLLVSKVEVLVDNIEVELMEEEERGRTNPNDGF